MLTQEVAAVKECGESLIAVNNLAPGIILTEHQFLLEIGKTPYGGIRPDLVLRHGAGARLVTAINLLRRQTGEDYRFVINSALRTYQEQLAAYLAVQDILRELHPDIPETALTRLTSRYVSNPPQSHLGMAAHLTGGAVDISLIKGLKRIPMAPPGPLYTAISRPDYYENPEHLITPDDLSYRNNRRLIIQTMTAAGFTVHPFERWHFDFGNWQWSQITGQPAIYDYIRRYGLTESH